MPDTTAPTLTSLVFPAVVDISNGNVGVTFTAGATDDESGMASVEIGFFSVVYGLDPAGFPDPIGSFTISDSALDPFSDGQASAQVTFAGFAPWYPVAEIKVTVTDKAGNSRTYMPEELAQMGLPNAVTIVGGKIDTTPPVLTSLTLPSVIDLTQGPTAATFAVGATDGDGQGVVFVDLSFDKPLLRETWIYNSGVMIESTPSLFAGNTASQSITLMPYVDSGIYHVVGASVVDQEGNLNQYDQAALAQLGIPLSFTVIGLGADATAPVFQSFAPELIDLDGASQSVNFNVGAMDAGTGVKFVKVTLDRPLLVEEYGGLYLRTYFVFQDGVESFADGFSSLTAKVSAYAEAGSYKIVEVETWDKVGNATVYDEGELALLPGGIPTFEIVDSAPDALPSLVSINIPETIDLAGVEQNITISAKGLDLETQVASIELFFDRPLRISGQKVQSWTLSSWGSFTSTLSLSPYNSSGPVSISKVVVTDMLGHSRTYEFDDLSAIAGMQTSFSLVGGINGPPTAPNSSLTVDEDESYSGNLLKFAKDPNDDALSVTSVNGFPPGVPVAGKYGTLIFSQNGDFTYVPDRAGPLANAQFYEQFSVTVSDGTAETVSNLFAWVNGDEFVEGTEGDDILHGVGVDDVMYAYGGNDILYGKDDEDSLYGGLGNDTYIVSSSEVRIHEVPGEGYDSVFVRESYYAMKGLPAVEVLAADVDFPCTLIGDARGQVILGNTGSDDLFGQGGSDIIRGGAGRDTVFGEAGNDTLFGDSGGDRLSGGRGHDILTGGSGRDTFVFESKPRRADWDKIADFSPRDDTIAFDDAAFATIGRLGRLPGDAFVIGSRARDAEDRVIYDRKSGYLYYDPDGTGSAMKIEIARLSKGLKVTAADFIVI